MRISLGLILGLKGAPHDRHHTHHEHHREKLDVTTEANIELSETTPKIPVLATTASELDEKNILQTTTEATDIIDKYDLENAVTEATIADDVSDRKPTESTELDLEQELAELAKTTQQTLTLVPNQMKDEVTMAAINEVVENVDSQETPEDEIKEVEAAEEVTDDENSQQEASEVEPETPEIVNEDSESTESEEVPSEEVENVEPATNSTVTPEVESEAEEVEETVVNEESNDEQVAEVVEEQVVETESVADAEPIPDSAEEIQTEVVVPEEVAETEAVAEVSEEKPSETVEESVEAMPVDESTANQIEEASENADAPADNVEDDSQTEPEVPEEVPEPAVVPEEPVLVEEIPIEESASPEIAEPAITPVVPPVSAEENSIKPTERSMLSDFAADLNGIKKPDGEVPADPSEVVVPDDYHPESPLNVATVEEVPDVVPEIPQVPEVPAVAEIPIPAEVASPEPVPAEEATPGQSEVNDSFPEVVEPVPEVPVLAPEVADVPEPVVPAAEPVPEAVDTPEQLADINLADQIEGFENLSEDQKKLVEQYVKMQLVEADKDESESRLEDEPEEEIVSEEDQIINDALDANDDDDGHIPPDLYGEPEPDEEVGETSYDYKNDYYQAQNSESDKTAGGLSWEKSDYDQAIPGIDTDQEIDHEQYDSFKAQEDDSHYIDHNDDEADAFNLESSGESVDYSNIIQTIVADAADDITEEPAANQESGIELDELIDRRKVELHQEKYREMERNEIEESKKSSKGWIVFFGCVGLFFIMMTRRKVRRLMPSSLGTRGGGGGQHQSQREKLTTVTSDRGYGSSNVDPWDWGKSD